MRAALAALFLVLLATVVPVPAQALSGCSGAWTASASCGFSCDDVNLYVSGFAQDYTGVPASVTVTAECGLIAPSGVFVSLYSVSCSASGGGTATCSTSGPNLSFPLVLVGVCTVTGNTVGTYGCSSAP